MHHRVVDLYAYRCSVAALVDARHHVDQLTAGDVVRVDTAVRHLVDVADDLHGDLAAATRALLSVEPDPGGRRTVAAVDRLAALTHVDPAAAPALAASLRRRHTVQPTLFEDQPPAEASA